MFFTVKRKDTFKTLADYGYVFPYKEQPYYAVKTAEDFTIKAWGFIPDKSGEVILFEVELKDKVLKSPTLQKKYLNDLVKENFLQVQQGDYHCEEV